MNRREILRMEAGEELDAMIAESVMLEQRPHQTPRNALDLQLCGNPAMSKGGNWVCLCKYEDKDKPQWYPSLFSTNISVAWLVVEKMKDSDRHNFDRMEKEPKDKGLYDPTFIDFCTKLLEVLEIGISEYSYPATLTIMRKIDPEAICKAVLLTKVEDD